MQDLLDALDRQAPACLTSAAFHAWRGVVLLRAGRPTGAIEALERALLIEPDQPGVQLDYAQALFAVGDTLAARSLLQQLAQRDDVPAALRPALEQQIAATAFSAWRTRWIVTAALGWDNNLNNAPSASQLTLTFPQGPVSLALLPSSQAQKGAVGMGLVQWQGLRPVGSQLWLLQAELRARHTTPAESRYQQADASATWLQAPDAPRQWIVRGGATRVDFGGQHLLQSLRASAQHQWVHPSGCRPSAGLDAEVRRYPASADLNGRYAGVALGLNCAATAQGNGNSSGNGGLVHQAFSAQLRAGLDQPDHAGRPGGAYRRTEVRIAWDGRANGFKLNTEYGYARQTDATGYSPLLGDNLARQTSRHSLRAEVAHRLADSPAAQTDWFVSAEVSTQTSNLAAFASRQTAVYGGVRWTVK